MIRHRAWKALSIAASAALLVGSTFVSGALAGDTRSVYIGSDAFLANNGVLTFTPVTAGGATKVDYIVANIGGQNLAHAILSIPVFGGTTPAGLTVNTVFGPNAGSCTVGTTSVVCDYGNLAAGAQRSISIIWNVAANFNTNTNPVFTASIQVNEQTNPNGSNTQVFTASSGSTVSPFSDTSLATFSPPGQTIKYTTPGHTGDTGARQTSVKFKAKSAGSLLNITEGSPGDSTGLSALYPCPAGLSCQPDLVQVTLDDGTTFGAPYIDWTLTALVPKTYTLAQAFVAHYPTGVSTPDWILYNTKKDACGTDPLATVAANHHCAISFTLGKPDKVTGLSLLTIEILTDANGGSRF